MKYYKFIISRSLYICLVLFIALSLAACDSQTDEQNSAQPTPSTQPTAAPTPTPTPPVPFTDVAQDSPYYDAVVWAYTNGIASEGETFGPADACTRGQVMTFLWRAKGSPEPQATESPFSDVSSDDWFYKPALWASENGIATGTAFNPGNPCTNGEALTFLWRAEGKPMAVAASDTYYARPLSWAETNGLFAGADFDPAAACSRADLMTYLYWAEEEWTLSAEDKAVQAEFEQIIYDAQLYEVHGSGLVYADYVDVDNDGKVELLTVELDYNKVIATVYMNTNGHVEKCTDTSWGILPGMFSICHSGGNPCLCVVDYQREPLGATKNYVFWKIGNGGFAFADTVSSGADGSYYIDWTGYPADYDIITEAEYNAVMEKYTNQTTLFDSSKNNLSIQNRGLLPIPEEYPAALARHRKARLEYFANYWATVDQTYTKTVQTEFEQIINESQLYEVHGSGLCYADYVDVEGDGKVELLTVGIGRDAVTVTVYMNNDGHTQKYCEQVFPFGSTCWLYLCTYNNHMCLHREIPLSRPDNVFYKIENGGLVLSDSISEDVDAEGIYYKISAEGNSTTISEAEYHDIMEKYANQKLLLGYSYSGVSVCSRGLLPSAEEYAAALAKQWETERDKIYAAVKNGDFSYFAGTYELLSNDSPADSLVLKDNGTISGGNSLFTTGQKPISVIVAGSGTIKCTISSTPPSGTVDWNDGGEEYYEICPVGVSREYGGNGSLDRVRIYYVYAYGGVGEWEFAKVS